MTPRRLDARLFFLSQHELAESPWWFESRWWWVDIEPGNLHSCDASGRQLQTHAFGRRVTAVAPRLDNDWSIPWLSKSPPTITTWHRAGFPIGGLWCGCQRDWDCRMAWISTRKATYGSRIGTAAPSVAGHRGSVNAWQKFPCLAPSRPRAGSAEPDWINCSSPRREAACPKRIWRNKPAPAAFLLAGPPTSEKRRRKSTETPITFSFHWKPRGRPSETEEGPSSHSAATRPRSSDRPGRAWPAAQSAPQRSEAG